MSDQLKHLNLTEKDFDMIVEGLDHLPNKTLPGEMLKDMMSAMLTKDKESMEKLTHDRERKYKEMENNKRELREDIKILQGKLLMLKRYLMQEGALKDTYDIINHIS